MAISMCVLGSGSGGNCTLVSLDAGDRCRHVLIDAGLSPRRTTSLLAALGVSPGDISDVLLTHLDTDHLHGGWIDGRDRPRFTWRVHRRHESRLIAGGVPVNRIETFDDRFELDASTGVDTALLPHDELGSTGFVIEHGGARLGFATDLGRASPPLLAGFSRLDALAIESNYDLSLQMASPRPAFVKRRIIGGLGHLSNEQALEAVRRIDRAGVLGHVVLLHLSRQCNEPRIIRRLWALQAPHLLGRLTITSQDGPTSMLHVPAAPLESPVRVRP